MENGAIRVVGEASSVQETLLSRTGLGCRVATLGSVHSHTVIQSIRVLRSKHPEIPVLVLASEGAEQVVEVVQEGASGYLSKTAPVSDFIIALETVGRGGAYIHPRVASTIFSKLRGARHQFADSDDIELSEREREVLEHLARGLSNSEIADKLFLSSSTVKSTLRMLFAKFAVSDRTHLVATAVSKGLIGASSSHDS